MQLMEHDAPGGEAEKVFQGPIHGETLIMISWGS